MTGRGSTIHGGSFATDFECLFHASIIDLLIPSISRCTNSDIENDEPGPSSSKSKWLKVVQDANIRDVAFFDEKLTYFVDLSLPPNFLGLEGTQEHEVPSSLLSFLSCIQLHITASFLPPLTHTQPPNPETSNTLAPPPSSSISSHHPTTPTTLNTPFPPVTPNPFPSMKGEENQYAQIEGQVVWEAEIVDERRRIIKGDDGNWHVVWKGEVPVAYVRTQIQNPLLGLTASITLRDGNTQTKTHKKGAFSMDTSSIRTAMEGHLISDENENDAENANDDAEDDLAMMEEIDLLGGLGGNGPMPGSRLGPSIRQDLSISDGPLRSATLFSSIQTPTSSQITSSTNRDRSAVGAMSPMCPVTTTLRKSFRRVMNLSPGLRVRMRTMFLPQLIPLDETHNNDLESENESEKRIVLCVEVENPLNSNTSQSPMGSAFEVEKVTVDISGKGGKAIAELLCQPEQKPSSVTSVFPIRLQPLEQYNLLYVVNIAAASADRSTGVDEAVARNLGKGDEQRPAAITIIGRPYISNNEDDNQVDYPTNVFNSKWNCTLDLTSYYASLSVAPSSSIPNTTVGTNRNRYSKPDAQIPPPNPIAGDKRYSLATLLSENSQSNNHRDSRQFPSKPTLPSQVISNQTNQKLPPSRPLPPQPPSNSSEGLLVSVKLLPQANSTESSNTIQPFDIFSIEIFVHNRTEEVRRFRLSVPPRDGTFGSASKMREILEKKSRNPSVVMKQDDPALRYLLSQHLSSSPPLISLENDVRCGPLLPGSSMSARMRFMALRSGVHKLEKLRVTGLGDDWDFVMSPVLDVIVGNGSDE